ncbi:hypothetical protein R69746_06396 [Paraburkholderia aspalathi]|uniref:hypothetical protein n=1 Tax=Paraburkholderia aspalathi TaxID=1324617 RepID=UPI00190B640D|nr:hypothetical protein [Paraburkholderia aspalathi]MBK3842331.1 hypothetical protein [Paraburkholderia aspalathi]CAE6828654.1 hypothetical protein R69746_06396 [Paraburkholderia aspalathi]CAE6854639.1 hypothetical protein R75465_07349 [Paraburkholderia aspalathi]
MKFSGIDLHSNNAVVAVIDDQDRVLYCKRLRSLHAAHYVVDADFGGLLIVPVIVAVLFIMRRRRRDAGADSPAAVPE